MSEMVDRILGLDLDVEHRANAVRAVASAARDAGECRRLLDMLGLSARYGVGEEPRARNGTVRKDGRPSSGRG